MTDTTDTHRARQPLVRIRRASYAARAKPTTGRLSRWFWIFVENVVLAGMVSGGFYLISNNSDNERSTRERREENVRFVRSLDVQNVKEYPVGGQIDLENADFNGLTFYRWNFAKSRLKGANFEGAMLDDTYWQYADLREAHLKDANLKLAHFENAMLGKADLTNAFLDGATFNGELVDLNLSAARLTNTQLVSANFVRGTFDRTRFDGSNLECASFVDVDLANAFFDRTDLNQTDLTGANLSGAILARVSGLETAIIVGVIFDDRTVWPVAPFVPPTVSGDGSGCIK